MTNLSSFLFTLFYRGAATIFSPLIWAHILIRCFRGKEDPQRYHEKRGKASADRPSSQKLIWVHCASVGEAMAVLELIRQLKEKDPHSEVLMTSGTLTSARLMAKKLPAGVIHQFAPLDVPRWVKRFLRYWRPSLVIWVESEFWPNTLRLIHEHGIPNILVNGRLSPSSYRRWSSFPKGMRTFLTLFSTGFAASKQDYTFLKALGVRLNDHYGNLKFSSPPLKVEDTALANLKNSCEGRPLWVAASLHPGEESIIGRVHKCLKNTQEKDQKPLCILAPRHPHRGEEFSRTLRKMGLVVARRSLRQDICPATDVYMVDTLGEMGLFYKLSPSVFMGGSLVPIGGHNLIEPAQLKCAITHGPYMDNFKDLANLFAQENAVVRVKNEKALAQEIKRQWDNPEETEALAHRAEEVVASQAGGILGKIIKEINSKI